MDSDPVVLYLPSASGNCLWLERYHANGQIFWRLPAAVVQSGESDEAAVRRLIRDISNGWQEIGAQLRPVELSSLPTQPEDQETTAFRVYQAFLKPAGPIKYGNLWPIDRSQMRQHPLDSISQRLLSLIELVGSQKRPVSTQRATRTMSGSMILG